MMRAKAEAKKNRSREGQDEREEGKILRESQERSEETS